MLKASEAWTITKKYDKYAEQLAQIEVLIRDEAEMVEIAHSHIRQAAQNDRYNVTVTYNNEPGFKNAYERVRGILKEEGYSVSGVEMHTCFSFTISWRE